MRKGLIHSVVFSLSFVLTLPIWAETQPSTHEVGTIAGSFDVTLSGSASYSIPLRVAPGTAGVEPRLALVYDSQAPSGPMGAGWSISGYSVITRGPKNLRFDGVVDGVRLQDSDALFLDGRKLIQIGLTGSGNERVIEYRKEYDDQSRVRQFGSEFATSTFVVDTKGGVQIVFDGSRNSRVKFNDGTILLYAASQVADSAGNYLEFSYLSQNNGDYDLADVRYTGNISGASPFASVTLEYESGGRAIDAFVAGRKSSRTTRLKSITSRVWAKRGDFDPSRAEIASRYELQYQERPTANRFVLSAVRQFGEDGSELIPTKFTYSDPKVGWDAQRFDNLPSGVPAIAGGDKLRGAYRFGHFSGLQPALPDLMFSALIDGKLESFAWRREPNKWVLDEQFRPPFAFSSSDGADLGAVPIDLDGDGRLDLLQSTTRQAGSLAERGAYLARAKWESEPKYVLPFDVALSGARVADLLFAIWHDTSAMGSTKRPDLVWATPTDYGFLRNAGPTIGWQDGPKPPRKPDRLTRAVDVDCDGLPELVYEMQAADGAWNWEIYKLDPAGWHSISDQKFARPVPPTIRPEGLLLIDLDDDKCDDIVFSTAMDGGNRGAWLANKDGWTTAPHTKDPPFDLIDNIGRPAHSAVAFIGSDGLPDVFAHHQFSTSDTTKWAFQQTTLGWTQLGTAFEPPKPLSYAGDSATGAGVFVGDLNNDGYTDIAAPVDGVHGFGAVYAGSVSGYKAEKDLAPPLALGRKDRKDGGIRFVDLNADGLPDIIYSRTEANGSLAAGAYLNSGSGWVAAPGLAPSKAIAGDRITGNPIQLVDVDGDGFIDQLYSYRTADGKVDAAYYKNVPDGESRKFELQQVTAISDILGQQPFSAEGVGDLGIRFVDLTGDGRIDVLVGYLPKKNDVGNSPIEICDPQNASKCDWNRSLFRTAAYINNGTSWLLSSAYQAPLPFVSHVGPDGGFTQELSVQVIDVDGDRLPDIVAHFKHPFDQSKTVREVWLNTGKGWARSEALSTALKGLLGSSGMPLLDEMLRDQRMQVQWADVNGDGLADIIFTKRAGANNASQVWLTTGGGWELATTSAKPIWHFPLEAMADRDGDPSYRLADVNGDGLLDVLFSRCELAACDDATVTRGLYVNNGSDWIAQDKALAPVVPFVDKDGVDQGVRLTDLDGNGLVDIVRSFAGGDANTAVHRRVLVNEARRSDILTEIEPGFGLRTTVFYQTMLETVPDYAGENLKVTASWNRAYVRPEGAETYPLISPVPASYVARRVVIDEGHDRRLSFSYRYGGFRIDLLAMRSLGFGFRESLNEVSGILTRSEMNQDPEMQSVIEREASCFMLGNAPAIAARSFCPDKKEPWLQLLSNTKNTWQILKGPVGGPGTGVPEGIIRQVSMSATLSQAYDLDGGLVTQQTDTFEYDSPLSVLDRRMNVMKAVSENIDGTKTETLNQYSDDGVSWFLGRLTKTTVTKTGDPMPEQPGQRFVETRRAGFEYDTKTGMLAVEIANFGHPSKSVTTNYLRDNYGNVIAATVIAGGEMPRTSRTEYDALGRFAIREVNPLGHELRKEPKLTTGQPIRVIGPNSLVTSFEYDGFGRTQKETSPAGVSTISKLLLESDPCDSSEVALCGPSAFSGVRAAYAVKTQVGTLPPTLTILDSKGRALRAVTEGFTIDPAVKRPVYQDADYDVLGRPSKKSLPYEPGAKPLFTTVSYDALGRVEKSIAPNGATSATIYKSRGAQGGEIVSITDPLGRVTTTETNLRKLPIVVTDPLSSTVKYTYDAGDRLVTLTGPTGAVTQHTYDDLGHRVRTIDPDIGTWEYAFDPFGRLIRQKDAKNQITRLEYDLLGRLTRKVQADSTATWDYDTARFGIGKLATVRSSDGYQEDYYYDELGRQNGWAVTIGREQFVTFTDFDELGRVQRITYPSAVAVVNNYDAKGFLIGVTDSKQIANYWQLLESDAAGRVTKEKSGSGVTTNYQFDAETGRAKKINSRTNANSRVLDLELDYDLVGNLQRRNEKVVNNDEIFDYDVLDRLTRWRRNNGDIFLYAYDAAGRITWKSEVGAYSYTDAAAPTAPYHAVKHTGPVGQQERYRYDNNGNLENGPTGSFQYTSENRLELLFANQNDWTRFSYSPNGNRYRQFERTQGAAVETLYIGAYERVTEHTGRLSIGRLGRLERHRHYLINGNGVFAILESNTERAEAPPQGGWISKSLSPLIQDSETPAVAKQTMEPPPLALGAFPITKVWYLHKDQLGSVIRITDEKAKLHKRYWFDPWGKRYSGEERETKPSRLGENVAASWNRGFTGHEHLDRFGFIHMNGRVMNARASQFINADALNQDPRDGQAANGYSYARNNPLRYVDPFGYSWFSDFVEGVGNAVGDIGRGIGHVVNEAGKWLEENWRTVVIVAVAIVVTVATGGAGATLGAAILAGMAGGAAGGAVGAALYGGSFEDVVRGAALGALTGAISGGLGYGIGYVGLKGVAAFSAQGLSGGLTTHVAGGNFSRGFWVGFGSAGVSGSLSQSATYRSSLLLRSSVSAIVGGSISQSSGGKFANGAITAAFATAFSHYAHKALATEGRGLTTGEREMIKKSGLKVDPDAVRVNKGPFLGIQDMDQATAPNGNVYMGNRYCGDFSASYCRYDDVFMHEMKHVEQYQNNQEVFLRGAGLLIMRNIRPDIDVYDYRGVPPSRYNLEQDAEAFQDQYKRSRGMQPHQ